MDRLHTSILDRLDEENRITDMKFLLDDANKDPDEIQSGDSIALSPNVS